MVYIALSGGVFFNNDDKISEWFVSYSTDEINSIKVELVERPFSIGPHNVNVLADNELLFSDEIRTKHNVNNKNYSIVWDKNIALLTFRGEKQEDANYEITFDGNIVTYRKLENP